MKLLQLSWGNNNNYKLLHAIILGAVWQLMILGRWSPPLSKEEINRVLISIVNSSQLTYESMIKIGSNLFSRVDAFQVQN